MTQKQNESDWEVVVDKQNAELKAALGEVMLAWINAIETVKVLIVFIEGSDYTDRKRWILPKGKTMSDHDIIEMLRARFGEGSSFHNLVETLHKGRRARNGLVHRLGEISSRGMIRDSDNNLLSFQDTQMRYAERKMRLVNRYEPFITRALKDVFYCLAFRGPTLCGSFSPPSPSSRE